MSEEILVLWLSGMPGIGPNFNHRSLVRQPAELRGQKHSPAAERLCRAGGFARNGRRVSSADFIRQNRCATTRDIVRYVMRLTSDREDSADLFQELRQGASALLARLLCRSPQRRAPAQVAGLRIPMFFGQAVGSVV
jgi:hypothetical protein